MISWLKTGSMLHLVTTDNGVDLQQNITSEWELENTKGTAHLSMQLTVEPQVNWFKLLYNKLQTTVQPQLKSLLCI